MNPSDTPPFDPPYSTVLPAIDRDHPRTGKAKGKRSCEPITSPVSTKRPTTHAEMMDARSPRAKRAGVKVWSKAQCVAWGVPHPLTTGWIDRLLNAPPEPQVCGPHCQTENILNAALRVIEQCSGVSEQEALDAIVVELLARR